MFRFVPVPPLWRLAPGLILACILLLPLSPIQAADPVVQESDITISRQGEVWVVAGNFLVPVAPAVAWAVLTDFDNMEHFLTNLSHSRVVAHQDNVLQVEQQGTARFGPFSIKFQSLREITLTPERRIHARGVSGTMRRFESIMELSEEEGGTRLSYRAEMVPDFWLPSLLAPSLFRHETAEQFSAMVAEMQRRR